MITQELLKTLISYDPETGVVTRIKSARRSRIGKPASTTNNSGHLQMTLLGRTHALHRLVWLYLYGTLPEGPVDHIDGNPQNNRPSNLRLADQFINAQNRSKPHRNNKSGYLGVSLNHGKWVAAITTKGKMTVIGRFDSKEKASEAYLAAKKDLHPEAFISMENT